MASPANNFTADSFRRVKVLYDYDYTDDHSRVWMKVDEIFYLLNSDGNDWWQVCRPDSPEDPFYVPSTYVEVLSDVSGTSSSQQLGHVDNNINIQTHSILGNAVGKSMMSTFKTNSVESDDEGSDYMNTLPKKEFGNSDSKEIKVQSISKYAKRPTDLVVEDDYVNLDQFREQAGIPSLVTSSDSHTPPSPKTPELESDLYANLQQLDIPEPTAPDLENSQFQRTLQDTWDVYSEPVSNRLFYVHKETKETLWKPPRGQFHEELHRKRRSRSSGEYEEVVISSLSNSRSNRKSRSVDYGRPRIVIETNVPDGWSYSVNETGEDVFINNETKQERSDGSSPAKSPPSEGENKPNFPALRPADRSQVSDRFAKSRSVMIENLHMNAPTINTGQPPPKSATLPPNYTAPIQEDLYLDAAGRGKPHISTNHHPQTVFQSVNINEPIEGWLNKCRTMNGKKPSRRWAMMFVKLGGSNLVFYKDQRSAQPKSGSQYGKCDQLVSLATSSVDKDTTKKNTFCNVEVEAILKCFFRYLTKQNNEETFVSWSFNRALIATIMHDSDSGSKLDLSDEITCPDCQILLQAENQVKMQEWFMKIHTRIQELAGCPSSPFSVPATTEPLTPELEAVVRKPSFKGHNRKPSETGTIERKGRIKNAIEKFLISRSDKEKLIKKGIYKDAVFGSDIKQLCAKEKTKVPTFVAKSIAAIEKRGLEHEGIYRVGGNISQIQKLRCMVDQGEQYDLSDPVWDVNILTGTLKLFFRELKDPLFTIALFDKFLKSFLHEKASERLKGIKTTIEELPKPHFESMKVLFKHLTNVVDQCRENKMAAHQLAIVFGPTLIWPEEQLQNLATSVVYQSRIVEFVLLEYKSIFR